MEIEPGEYKIKVEADGYKPSETIVIAVTEGETVEVEIVLERKEK